MKKKLFFCGVVCLLGVCFTSCDSGCTCELKLNGEVMQTQELEDDEQCDAVDGVGASYGGYTAKWSCN